MNDEKRFLLQICFCSPDRKPSQLPRIEWTGLSGGSDATTKERTVGLPFLSALKLG